MRVPPNLGPMWQIPGWESLNAKEELPGKGTTWATHPLKSDGSVHLISHCMSSFLYNGGGLLIS